MVYYVYYQPNFVSREKAPGQSECEKAIELLMATLGKMDKAGMAVLSQNLPPIASTSLEGFQDRVLQSASEIGEIVDPLTIAALGEAENLGHRVTALANQFPQLASAAIGLISRTQSSQLQMSLVEEIKTVIESALQLLYASKEAGGNPKVCLLHEYLPWSRVYSVSEMCVCLP